MDWSEGLEADISRILLDYEQGLISRSDALRQLRWIGMDEDVADMELATLEREIAA